MVYEQLKDPWDFFIIFSSFIEEYVTHKIAYISNVHDGVTSMCVSK